MTKDNNLMQKLSYVWMKKIVKFFTNRSISKQVGNYKLDIQIKDRNSRKTYIGWNWYHLGKVTVEICLQQDKQGESTFCFFEYIYSEVHRHPFPSELWSSERGNSNYKKKVNYEQLSLAKTF